MTLSLKLINAAIYGTLGTMAVFLAAALEWPAWILFIGWISYFQFGATLRNAGNTAILISLGMLLAMFMTLCAGWLAPYWGNYGILPVVFILIAALSFLEHEKWFGNIAAWFLGMVVFFAAGHPPDLTGLPDLGLPVATGLLFGWLSAWLFSMARRNSTTHNPL